MSVTGLRFIDAAEKLPDSTCQTRAGLPTPGGQEQTTAEYGMPVFLAAAEMCLRGLIDDALGTLRQSMLSWRAVARWLWPALCQAPTACSKRRLRRRVRRSLRRSRH
jgi:hypothetical protein